MDNWGGENNGWAGQENILKFAEQNRIEYG